MGKMTEKENKKLRFETLAIHGCGFSNEHGAVTQPIYKTSTFGFDSTKHGEERFSGKSDGFVYTRVGNPNNREVEQTVALLEGADDSVSFASGMAAISNLVLHLCETGDNILSTG